MARVISVFSIKGGVGKTTIAVNLALAFTKYFNKKVILVDTNVNSGHVGLHLDLYEDSVVTIKDAISKKISDANFYSFKVLDRENVLHELKVLPCPLKLKEMFLNYSELRSLLEKLKERYEIVVLDTSPGVGYSMMTAAKSTEEAIVVSTPEIPTVSDTLKTLTILKKFNKKILGIALNRVKNESYELSEKDVESTCKAEVIVKIPEDKKVPESIAKGVPAVISYPNSAFSKSIRILASKVLGEYVEISTLDKIKEIFKRFFR